MALLGIDIGGTGIKAAVFSENGELLASRYEEHEVIQPYPGCFELDSKKIWECTQHMISSLALECNGQINAITISSLGECFVCLDKNDEILSNCITYHDKRGQEFFEDFQEHFKIEKITEILGGSQLSYVQSLFRLCLLRHERPDIIEKTKKICFLADFILYMLGGEHQCDYSLASTSGCFNPQIYQWHYPFIHWAGLDPDIFPQPVPTGTCIGKISKNVALSLNITIPETLLVLGGNDQLASSIGSGIYHPGEVFNAIGTADAMRTFTYDKRKILTARMKNLTYEAHYFSGLYTINPGANYSGAVLLKWFRDHFCRMEKYFCVESNENFYSYYEHLLPKDPTDLIVLPQFASTLGHHPYGAILNLSLDTKNETIYRAFMEGETYLMRSRLEKLKSLDFPVNVIKTIGGASNSHIFMQLRADILNTPVATINYDEPGTLGNAILGGVAAQIYDNADEIVSDWVHIKRIYEPVPDNVAYYNEAFEKYCVAETSVAILNKLQRSE